jgi:Fe2+ transport system protein B
MNTRAFLTKAGTIIFCLSVILWAMAYYPRLPESKAQQVKANVLPALRWAEREKDLAAKDPYVSIARIADRRGLSWAMRNLSQDRKNWAMLSSPESVTPEEEKRIEADPLISQEIAAAQAEYSLSGRLGHFMEPAIRPLGYDWKMGIGLVSAFAAREVFISSMGIVYSVGNVEDGKTADLANAMRADTYSSGPRAGKPVWTPIVAVSLLVWFVLAMQCMSTFAVVRRETGGWRWPIFMLVYMNALAYVVALLVYQVGTRVFV